MMRSLPAGQLGRRSAAASAAGARCEREGGRAHAQFLLSENSPV